MKNKNRYQTNDTARKQFLALLRAGLWGRPTEMEYFPENSRPDWKGILYLGKTQAVLPLIYDGMQTLPPRMQLEGTALMKLLAYVDRVENLNISLNRAAVEITERLSAEGIRSVLLKGQGLAALYRNPLHRQCGDIDLWVGEENYRRAADIIRTWPEIHDEMPESPKHIGFGFRNAELELHRNIFEVKNPAKKKEYEAFERSELAGDNEKVMITVDKDKDIPEGKAPDTAMISVPPYQFNIFYVFYHGFNHFMEGGLGLRQFCDLAVMLHHYHNKLDIRQLEAVLEKFRLDREWQLFICLLSDSLGLPENEAPMYDRSLSALALKLLETIFNDGNFGQHKDLPDFSRMPKLLRKAGNLGIHHIMLARRIRFSRRQAVNYYKGMWLSGLKNIAK